MCFSAPASFVASGGLLSLGGASFAAAKKEDRIIAAIPLFFGIQQGIEGIQWLYLNHGSVSVVAGYGYLFFAFILWPIYTPLFVYILDKKRRKFLQWFVYLGIATSLYSLGAPIVSSLTIEKINMCINYSFNYPFGEALTTFYLVAVFGPFFASSFESFKWFGVLFAITAIIAHIFFTVDFVSVWCFFAAVVSFVFLIYVIVRNRQTKEKIIKINNV